MVVNCCCCACVSTSEVAVIETFGEFTRMAQPGLTTMCWPCTCVAGSISSRVQQLNCQTETKTKDNVFITVDVCIQYQVIVERSYEAFYRLSNAQGQIRSYVYDVIRSTMPKMDLDDAFASTEDVARAVKEQLSNSMMEYGYLIIQALVTDLAPDRRVKDAMNEINASRRLREAASNKAEADKIMLVKSAEAEAEAKYLSGVGVAKQRQAIVAGLRDSIHDFSSSVPGTTPKDVMDLLLLTQYFDMLRDVGSNTKSSTVFLPHAPDAVASLQSAIRNGFMQSAAATHTMER